MTSGGGPASPNSAHRARNARAGLPHALIHPVGPDTFPLPAEVVELVDALRSGRSGLTPVRVRVPASALNRRVRRSETAYDSGRRLVASPFFVLGTRRTPGSPPPAPYPVPCPLPLRLSPRP